MIKFAKVLFRIPWHIIFLASILVVVGSLALYSASEGSWVPWAGRHVMRAGVGLAIVIIFAFIDFKYIRMMVYPLFLATIAVLILLLFIGSGNGVSRWITVGGFTFQPSEPAKIAVIMALARYFNEQPADKFQSILIYLPIIVLVGIPFLLVLKQPDLGTALMLLLGAFAVIFVAGMPWHHITIAFISGCAVIPIFWMNLHAYQKARVMTFLNPEADMLGAGYQIAQSKIALGSGGMFGKGFLLGSQTRLNYLPEKQTDFVFTMIGEEFGLVGNLFILLIYMLIIAAILHISHRVASRFAQLSCVGVAAMLFLYMFVNVAMVTGLLPVVGAPLPLISYGGTAMLTVFVGIGIVTSANVHDRIEH